MSEILWRLTLFCLCCALAIFMGLRLYDQSEQKHVAQERVQMLALKRNRLKSLVQKKALWLSSGEKTDPQDILDRLSELRLCTSILDRLMQNAYHPFLRDSAGVMALLDKLDENRMRFKANGDTYALVSPVYMEGKDLEKMIEIIENKGEFSPVEIKELDFKKECLLGGELWRVDHLLIGRVGADGALL